MYRDELEPAGLVEVLGEGISIHHNARFVVIKLPEQTGFELVRPAEFDQEITVKSTDGNGTSVIRRFTPINQIG